jgi:hypothetical protein
LENLRGRVSSEDVVVEKIILGWILGKQFGKFWFLAYDSTQRKVVGSCTQKLSIVFQKLR